MTGPLRDIPAAAEWLGIPLHQLKKLVSARRVPHTRIGRHVRFTEAHLAQIVAAGEQAPLAPPTAIRSAPRRRRAA